MAMDFLLDNATPILITSLAFTAILLCLPQSRKQQPAAQAKTNAPEKARVVVLVLGDIGRSPRMQYHALSIARKGGKVDLVGYNESPPRPELLSSPDITIHSLPSPPASLTTSAGLLFPILAPIKILLQLYHLLTILLYAVPSSASYILLQNPPSMPTFVVAWLVGRMRGMTVVIDWHNFGWTILRQKLGNAPVVHLARVYEKVFGKIAGDINFTVTNSMKDVLRGEYGITAPIHALHDRPPSHFQPLPPEDLTNFLTTHSSTSPHSASLLTGKTKLLVSSTSWTPDENFQLLLDALIHYDRTAGLTSFLSLSTNPTPTGPNLPDILLIITGKGPLKEYYLSKIEQMELTHVTIKTAWLEAEDYPKLLAAADLGVCLHTSSSGVDLPMKVVDMFGVGVPVAAVRFAALGELVVEGQNGVGFDGEDEKGGEELGGILTRLFHPKNEAELKKLKKGAEKEMEKRWDETWDEIAAPVFGL